MAAAAPLPAATVAIIRKSDGVTNVLPEHHVDRVAEGRDAGHGDDGDQRSEKSVFEEVLTFVVKDDGAGYYETDFYAAVTVAKIKATYTAYTYPKLPSISDSAIQELMFSTSFSGKLAP